MADAGNLLLRVEIRLKDRQQPTIQLHPVTARPSDLCLAALCYASKMRWVLTSEPALANDLLRQLLQEAATFWDIGDGDLIARMPTAAAVRSADFYPRVVEAGEMFRITFYGIHYGPGPVLVNEIPRPGFVPNLPWSVVLLFNAVFVLLPDEHRAVLRDALRMWSEGAWVEASDLDEPEGLRRLFLLASSSYDTAVGARGVPTDAVDGGHGQPDQVERAIAAKSKPSSSDASEWSSTSPWTWIAPVLAVGFVVVLGLLAVFQTRGPVVPPTAPNRSAQGGTFVEFAFENGGSAQGYSMFNPNLATIEECESSVKANWSLIVSTFPPPIPKNVVVKSWRCSLTDPAAVPASTPGTDPALPAAPEQMRTRDQPLMPMPVAAPVPQPVSLPAESRPTVDAPVAQPPAEPALQAIRFSFIGLMRSASGTTMAALKNGDAVVLRKEGEVVDGDYRIVKIGESSIVVERLDGRGRQTIALAGK